MDFRFRGNDIKRDLLICPERAASKGLFPAVFGKFFGRYSEDNTALEGPAF